MTITILGTNDDNTTCDKCGKTNLKKTVVLNIDGSVVYYGSDCAANALTGSKKNKKSVDTQAMAIQQANIWISKGHSLEVIAQGIWNKYGYRTGVKNNALYIDNFGVINGQGN